MKAIFSRLPWLVMGLWLMTPVPLWSHEGHAGDHGWLAGAAQPLLSLDHFLAAVSVAAGVALGVALIARRRDRPRVRAKS